ncbi:MAG: hypothetical protein ACKVUT_09435 [Gaiella sp.]
MDTSEYLPMFVSGGRERLQELKSRGGALVNLENPAVTYAEAGVAHVVLPGDTR